MSDSVVGPVTENVAVVECEICGSVLTATDESNCGNDDECDEWLCSKHFAVMIANRLTSGDVVSNDNPETLSIGETMETKDGNTMAVAMTSDQIKAMKAAALAQIAALETQEKEIASIVKIPAGSGKAKPERKSASPSTMTDADVSALLPAVSKFVPVLHGKLLDAKMAKQADSEYILKCKTRNASWTPYTGKGLHSHYDGFAVHVAQLASGILDKIAASKGKTNDRKFNFMDGVMLCKALCESKVLESHPVSGGYSYYIAGTMPKKDNGASAKVKDTISDLLAGFTF